jgi:RNA polymerase sigma-70 factor (ECF subfamily)
VSLDDAPELYLYERTRAAGMHGREEDPARSLLSRLDTDRVRQAIAELPEEYRSVAALNLVEDLSYQDIADALDIPPGTVRSRLHRARRRLQVTLWELAVEEGIVPASREPGRSA